MIMFLYHSVFLEVLESTRISESSVMVDSAPMPLPILPRVSPSSASPPEVKGQGYSQVNNKGDYSNIK